MNVKRFAQVAVAGRKGAFLVEDGSARLGQGAFGENAVSSLWRATIRSTPTSSSSARPITSSTTPVAAVLRAGNVSMRTRTSEPSSMSGRSARMVKMS